VGRCRAAVVRRGSSRLVRAVVVWLGRSRRGRTRLPGQGEVWEGWVGQPKARLSRSVTVRLVMTGHSSQGKVRQAAEWLV
jgi:hypothetical protein